ncbi:cytochrome c [Melioribacter roseus P3M-2]|uniref:Cytochrome c n=1 Tax=Melioribacter roseus (strain DSM 23840 / JCM 17771 / VKM B-2668 / P3M-2) TaxID=1191523 RepID=I6YUU7_MELRP|nr:cytochrome c [Melioribacter roseus]AFN74342.1 cytochrome c [Melioribacter roseus P3M-2]
MKKTIVAFLTTVLIFTACSSEEGDKPSGRANEKLAAKFGLTVFEYENGIGPIKEKLNIPAEIDQIMAQSGKEIFDAKCTQCHKINERYTGPALGDVTKRRSPEYIMNMILNPTEMTQKHPEAKKLLGLYATQMTFQNVSKEDARKILEYLRSVSN